MTLLERYRLAGDLDTQGDEVGAIAHYDAVFADGVAGLPADLIEHFFVGYSSTLRNVGRCEESLRIVRAGLGKFPNSSALRAFEALALLSLERAPEAVATLITTLLDAHTERSIETFRRSLTGYAAELRSQSEGKTS